MGRCEEEARTPVHCNAYPAAQHERRMPSGTAAGVGYGSVPAHHTAAQPDRRPPTSAAASASHGTASSASTPVMHQHQMPQGVHRPTYGMSPAPAASQTVQG